MLPRVQDGGERCGSIAVLPRPPESPGEDPRVREDPPSAGHPKGGIPGELLGIVLDYHLLLAVVYFKFHAYVLITF